MNVTSWGGGVNEAYSLISTTHGHVTDCKLDPVVYAGVYVVITCGPVLFVPNDLRPTILGCQKKHKILGCQKRLNKATGSIPPQVN